MSILVAYDPDWPKWFSALSCLIGQALETEVVSIHHVGSTAIPGMIAKPIIDIDVEIPDYSRFGIVEERLENLGYQNQGEKGIPDRIAFGQADSSVPHCSPAREWIQHHLYVCPSFSTELKRHLQFRDHLRRDAAARDEYGRIKTALEKESTDDRKVYAALKEERARAFVEGILQEALGAGEGRL